MNKRTAVITAASTTIPIILIIGSILIVATVSAEDGVSTRPVFTEEHKQVIREIHDLKQQGDYEGAKALAEEAGLPIMISGPHFRCGFGPGLNVKREEVREAILEGDYDKFKELTADASFAEQIDEAAFERMVEAHKLMLAGEFEAAREIMQELGIKPLGGGQGMMGQGMKGQGMRGQGMMKGFGSRLSDEQREQVKNLIQSGEHEAAKELMKEFRAQTS